MPHARSQGKRQDLTFNAHAVLCAADYNNKWLLRIIAKKGVAFLRRLYLRPCAVARLSPNLLGMPRELFSATLLRPTSRLVKNWK